MTAKEMKEIAKHVACSYKMDNAYVFSTDGMQAFIDQLCKEQREICAENADTDLWWDNEQNGFITTVDKDTIINAKQPEV